MFEFLRRLRKGSEAPPPIDPQDALRRLAQITSDAVIEDVWDAMDQCADAIEGEVRERMLQKQLGEYPLHAATLWLGYQRGNVGAEADEALRGRLVDSIVWAFRFEENNVLLGGALGALDAIAAPERETVALHVFDELGPESARRYWLLLKVRTDEFVRHAFEALDAFARTLPEPPEPADPESPDFVDFLERLGPRRRMAGAFRQFTADDVDVLLRHFNLENAGAEFLVSGLASTRSPRVVEQLERAAQDPRPAVRRAAEAALEQLD